MTATPTPAPRRHTPFTVPTPAPRITSRVTDAADWRVRKPVGFNAAI